MEVNQLNFKLSMVKLVLEPCITKSTIQHIVHLLLVTIVINTIINLSICI
jgi:hypothetical protein